MTTSAPPDPLAGPEQHGLMQSIGLHIIPGVLLTILFFILKPVVERINYPPLLAFILAVLLVDIPFQLGVMVYQGQKRNGRFSLQGKVINLFFR